MIDRPAQEVISLLSSPESPATKANANTKAREADLIDKKVTAKLKILQAELKVAEIKVKIAQQEGQEGQDGTHKDGTQEGC